MPETFRLSRRSFMAMPIVLAACKTSKSAHNVNGLTMGTNYTVVAADPKGLVSDAELKSAIEASLSRVTAQMSNWDAGSELSQLNASRATTPMSVSSDLSNVLLAAQEVHEASDGRFDVTVGRLIDLWGFGAGDSRKDAPSEADVTRAMAQSGQTRALRIGNGMVQKTLPEAEIYLSAIGKGYGVDQVAQTLRGFGLKDFMVEIGGDLYVEGRNPNGRPWQIGIETPEAFDRGVYDVVTASGNGVATSGDYRNYFVEDGTRYSHIIDPTTGRPVTHMTSSVTVVADNAMLADAWATALLVLGRERGLEIADQQNLAVLFVDRDADHNFTSTPSARYAEMQA